MSPGFFVSPYAAGHDTMNLTWVNASGPITLWLENGPVENLVQVERIAELPPSTTSYLYTPPVSLANGNYTFQIQDADGSNWSKWFTLTNGIGATSSSLSQSASNAPVPTSTLSPSASNSPTSQPSTLSPSASNSSTSQPLQKLSTGDKVAIGEGAVLGVVLVAVAIWFTWGHRRPSATNLQILRSEASFPLSYLPNAAK
ncbi:uncharacterized protein K444DRAFT_301954 [Hyaloscypha bicolor E]|uniref:Yeast cell wall synthesis Kre9/Knh1-like N-terminal domain-containing protein n=1 Tax=Hyaloscypha bicolor E TaxID=1095630 RepID=A0A2J6SEH3_9HELO|nr:uncharacterized protein K444DRAFT_301954 [Hyaloscypha bicolor E]PMD49156.1 hypothetical protein K444DRAFT_301954 [Hyaloscypha bicolor E]